MDLKITGPETNAAERAAIDAVLGAPRSAIAGHEARAQRDQLLPALRAAQARFGWIPPGAFNYICERLTVAPADAFGVASFYHMLSTEPEPAAVAHVCDDVACRVLGGEEICRELERDARVRRSPCLGLCERAPAALAIVAGEWPVEVAIAPASAEKIRERLENPHAPIEPAPIAASVPQAGSSSLRLLARVGRVDPSSQDAWRASGGGAALIKALAIGPAAVVREVTASGLLGRGGAAFPTGRKWDAVAKAPERPHYAVMNADESEPGTFKDRVLLEEDPFTALEGLAIAAFATGSTKGFVYIRGEYPLAAARIETAIAAMRGRWGFDFDVELRRGAGAYICGEETALFNSIEGKRGEPRNKPPYPVQSGLFAKPTVINNVETLANVPLIVLDGGAAFAGSGTSGSTGPKLFCVSGHVAKPGVYEVRFGTTLRELIALAGGVRGGRAIRAILLGGAAGTFVSAEKLDTPLTFEGTRAIGASLGSGVVMVFDDATDLGDTLARIARFFKDESCGQCVPCRVGTERQDELVLRLRAGRPLGSIAEERVLLRELGQAMRDASICGLGQTASSAIESALASFEPFAKKGARA